MKSKILSVQEKKFSQILTWKDDINTYEDQMKDIKTTGKRVRKCSFKIFFFLSLFIQDSRDVEVY